MADLSTCPSRDDLQRMLLGKLPAADAEEIESRLKFAATRAPSEKRLSSKECHSDYGTKSRQPYLRWLDFRRFLPRPCDFL